MELTVKNVPVTVLRKRVKNINIHIEPRSGAVVASAPLNVSEQTICRAIESKISWILRKREELAACEKPLTYVTGERIPVWGERLPLTVQSGKKTAFVCDGQAALLTVKEGAAEADRKKAVEAWYRAALKSRIAERLPQLEQQSGLFCNGFCVRNMRSRWGSCNVQTHHINLSLQLAEKAPVFLDYVLLHELAHTKVPDHGAAFKALMDDLMPDWRAVRERLNERGRMPE